MRNTAATLKRARRSDVSGKRFGLDRGESLLDFVRQRPCVLDEVRGERAGALEQRTVAAELRELQIREPRLPRTQQLAAAAQLEVDLRELEAVGGADEGFEPGGRRIRQLVSRARDQEAVRLLGGATDASPQLMELCEPEAIRLLHDHDRRVRHVDADLDHRRRDEDVELA